MNTEKKVYKDDIGALWNTDVNSVAYFGKLDIKALKEAIATAEKDGWKKVSVTCFVNKGAQDGDNRPAIHIVESRRQEDSAPQQTAAPVEVGNNPLPPEF